MVFELASHKYMVYNIYIYIYIYIINIHGINHNIYFIF